MKQKMECVETILLFTILLLFSVSASHGVEPSWCNLKNLQDTYKEAKGTKAAAYVHQYLCMLEKSCDEYRKNGDQGWAHGFINSTFSYQSSLTDIHRSVDMECPTGWSQVQCFKAASGVHGTCELSPSFSNYCDEIVDCKDPAFEGIIDRWTRDHDLFLTHAFDPCFQEVLDNDELPRDQGLQLKAAYRSLALGARKAAQAYCERELSPWGLLGSAAVAIEGINDEFMCKKK